MVTRPQTVGVLIDAGLDTLTDKKWKRSLNLEHIFPSSLLVWVQISPPLTVVSWPHIIILESMERTWKAVPACPPGGSACASRSHRSRSLGPLDNCFPENGENYLSLLLDFFFSLLYCVRCSNKHKWRSRETNFCSYVKAKSIRWQWILERAFVSLLDWCYDKDRKGSKAKATERRLGEPLFKDGKLNARVILQSLLKPHYSNSRGGILENTQTYRMKRTRVR